MLIGGGDTTKYKFAHWEDGSTNPTRSVAITQDLSLVATYEPTQRTVQYSSTPISVIAQINSTPVMPNTSVIVADGTVITISVPAEVET